MVSAPPESALPRTEPVSVTVSKLLQIPASPISAVAARYTRPTQDGRSRVDTESLLSLKEAAARFGVSRSHLQLLARTGRLEAVRLGHEWFTTAAAVEAYLANTALRSRNPYKNQRR